MWKVLVSAPYMQPVLERFVPMLRAEGILAIVPRVDERLSEEQLLSLVGDIDGAICGDDRFTRRVLESALRLKVISKWGTGIDSIDRAACAQLGIRVCNTPGAFTQPVADSVMAYVLSFARRTPWMDRRMKSGDWHKDPGVSLGECTLGIIGLGNIGQAVARRAAAFNMRILGFDVRVPPAEVLERDSIQLVDLPTLLAESDFVSLNCDLNPTSFHLINEPALSRMKPTAVLINTARGPIVDEPALVAALGDRRIAGAALDVFEVEPLPLDSPLRAMDQVLLAGHNSNSSPTAWERVHLKTIRNLLAGLKEVTR